MKEKLIKISNGITIRISLIVLSAILIWTLLQCGQGKPEFEAKKPDMNDYFLDTIKNGDTPENIK